MSTYSNTVLVIEDELPICKLIRQTLEQQGYAVVLAHTMAQALLDAATHKPDLIVLDLGLPDGDGIGLIAQFRTWLDAPILILSANMRDDVKIKALDAGADDYLSKPFSMGELLARIRALLRRVNRSGEHTSPIIRFGEVVVDVSLRLVQRNGQTVHLTPIEYHLLTCLLRHPDKVLTQTSLLREVWGPTFVDSGHYLRIYIARLRQKLELDSTQPQHFMTEIGVGYRFKSGATA